ncbi:hypothetical protein ACQ86N_29440 [Puia sp. P3]|uniref:hypothetical protein n=1 Tax=Puia sp. P3 TaxID=3423952 RepID=UPI003D6676E7
MRQFAYIRKRIRRLLAVVFILLLLVAGLAWWTVHYRLRQSLRLLVAEESKGQLALEVGEAGVSFTRGSLHLREVRLYTTDTALWSTAYDVRIPEVFLSLASWMALVRDKKLLVDSLAIRASSVWIRSGRPDTGSARRAWQVEDARNALETALGRMNVHSFSLRVDSLRLADGGSRRLVAGGSVLR